MFSFVPTGVLGRPKTANNAEFNNRPTLDNGEEVLA